MFRKLQEKKPLCFSADLIRQREADEAYYREFAQQSGLAYSAVPRYTQPNRAQYGRQNQPFSQPVPRGPPIQRHVTRRPEMRTDWHRTK